MIARTHEHSGDPIPGRAAERGLTPFFPFVLCAWADGALSNAERAGRGGVIRTTRLWRWKVES